MEIIRTTTPSVQVKFEGRDDQGQTGRASVVLVRNELHPEPYALLEDVFVREDVRGSGLSTSLVQACIDQARAWGCYKVILSHRPGAGEFLTRWYDRKFGFTLSGNTEMRLDLVARCCGP